MLNRCCWNHWPIPFVAIGLATTVCHGDDSSRPADQAGVMQGVTMSAGVAAATSLSNIDAVVLRSTIQPNLLKGNFGEAHMNRHLAKHFAKTGGWKPLQARVGPQGIDGLYLKHDGAGQPTGLIVSEAKYGSSQLKSTVDGIQMGKQWRTTRLDAMGKNYRSIAAAIRSDTMRIAGPGGSVGKQRLQIDLPGTRKAAVFTRSASNKPWEYVGPKRLLTRAGEQADRIGRYLQQASRGEVAYESVIYRVQLKNNALHVTIKDAASLGLEGAESKLATRHALKIPLTDRQLSNNATILRSEVTKHLRERFPHLTSSDVDAHSKRIVRDARDFEKILNSRPPSVVSAITWNSAKIGGMAAIVDVTSQVVSQYLTTGSVRWGDVAVSGVIAFTGTAAGAAAGQATTAILVRSAASHQLISRASAALGIGSTRLLPPMIGGTVGGGVASVLFAVGGYAAGYYDASTAARMGVVGVSSTAMGLAAGGGLFALATTIGTASTGTAIATLHGAAATSAAMAWLGGGTIAAGGFGVAGGAVVVSGGAAIVVVGTAICFQQAFAYWDEGNDLRRIQLTIERLTRKTEFIAVASPIGGFSTMRIGNH